MTLHRIVVANLRETPWKNGGGHTLEIACWPPTADLSSFDWRVSIASIKASGPFSIFPGIQRTIMLLDGPGMQLRSMNASMDHRLDQPLVPFSFSGDTSVECELLGAPSSDFNVMVRASRLDAEVRILRGSGALSQANQRLLFALNGEWTLRLQRHTDEHIRPIQIESATGAWWSEAAPAGSLRGSGVDSTLIEVTFKNKTPSHATPR